MKRIAASAALAASMVVATSLAVAQGPKPEDVVQFRQGVYKVIGWYSAPLGAMAKGDIPFDANTVARNAEIVAQMSKIAPDAFVRGSNVGDSAVESQVWSHPEEFKAKMEAFQKEAAKLAEVAKGSDVDAVRAQIGETGKACHEDFRKRRK
jgi:cytochrome c556